MNRIALAVISICLLVTTTGCGQDEATDPIATPAASEFTVTPIFPNLTDAGDEPPADQAEPSAEMSTEPSPEPSTEMTTGAPVEPSATRTPKPHKTPPAPGSTSTASPTATSDTTPGVPEPEPSSEPSPEPVATTATGPGRWIPNWCSLRLGMTKDRAIDFMGAPSSSFGTDSAYPQIRWANKRIKFTAFLRGGKVWQLQADYSKATATEKTHLTCDRIRS